MTIIQIKKRYISPLFPKAVMCHSERKEKSEHIQNDTTFNKYFEILPGY